LRARRDEIRVVGDQRATSPAVIPAAVEGKRGQVGQAAGGPARRGRARAQAASSEQPQPVPVGMAR